MQWRLRFFFSVAIVGTCPLLGLAQAQNTQAQNNRSPSSQGKEFGLGVILGYPTGVSFDFAMGAQRSLDGALAWNLGDSAFHLHADYLWRFPQAIRVDRVALGAFAGIGARLRSIPKGDETLALGPRFPVGIQYGFSSLPLTLFFEIALVMDVIPSTRAFFGAGLGARYYF